MSAVERFELRVAALFARHRGDVARADALDAEADVLDQAEPLHPLLTAATVAGVVELRDRLAATPGSQLPHEETSSWTPRVARDGRPGPP